MKKSQIIKKIINEKFASKAQQRFFYAMADKDTKKGRKFKKWAKEFSDDTDFDELPEKVVKESIEYQDMTFNIVNDIINIINRTQGVKGKKEYYLPLEGETYDGTCIRGEDCIRIIGQLKKECCTDLDCDADVDGTDASMFKEEFGRKNCRKDNPCIADFHIDGDVDGADAFTFKSEFGTKLLW